MAALPPQAARPSGESGRVTGQRPGVAFAVSRRADVYKRSVAKCINIVGHYVCDLNAFKGSCSFVILPETT